MAKITDPSKLLPSAKSTAITKIGKANFTSPLKVSKKSTSITKGLLGESNQKDAVDVNNKLVKIEKFFQSELLVSKKKAETKRKEKEKEDFKKEEEKLEAPKEAKKFKLPGLKVPGMSFLDRIKRFLFFTALGWLFTRFQDQLPKLLGVVKVISGVYGVAEDLFGKMFNGFMSLVKYGGDLKDKTLGFIATAKAGVGGNYQKEFDKLEKQFNTFVNASIIAGVLAADIGGAAVDEYNKWRKKNVEPGKPKPGEPSKPKPGEKPKGRPKVTEGRGGEKPTGKPKVTGDVKPGKPPGWWSKILKGPFAKLKGPLSRFAGAAVPGLGAAVGAADAVARFKAGDKIGGTLASISATLDGLAAGSAILALTGVGATVPAAFGLVSMGIDVVLLIRDIIKAFFPYVPMFSRGGRVVRKYQGGGPVTRGGKPQGRGPSRTLKTTSRRRPLKIKPKQSQPGKDIGGKEKIKILYPDTGRRFITEKEYENWKRVTGSNVSYTQYLVDQRQSEGKRPNPYKALTNTAKILKDIPLVGGLMGAAVDIALGEKPDKQVYKNIAYGIGNLVNNLTNENVNKSISSLMTEIKGFANGGEVPSRERKGTYSTMNAGDFIARVLEATIGQKVNEAIQSIEKELTLRGKGESGRPGGPGGPGGGGPGGGGPDGGPPLYGGPGIEGLSDFIAKAETGGRWNAYNGDWREGKRGDDTILTLKLTELRSYMDKNYPNSSGAVGAYQFMPETAIAYAKQLGLDPSKTVFSAEIQRKLNIQHLRDMGYDDYVAGKLTRDQYGRRISQQYRAVPDPTTGYTYSDNASSRNRATVSLQDYNTALDNAKQKAQPIVVSPGKIPKADYVKGVLDESGEPGFDVTWKGDNNIAVLPGRVKEVGQLYGSGYGNVVVVESVDPVTGKKVDVLYAHFPNGGISVRPGQQVGAGQVLGRMGKPGEPGIGNITGQHASIDFFEPNSNSKYSRWDGLSREIISSAQTGNNPSNWPKPQTQPPGGTQPGQPAKSAQKPGVINASNIALGNLNDRVSKLKPGEKIVFDRVGSIQLGTGWLGRPQIKYYNSTGSSISKEDFDKLLAPSEVLKKMRSNDRQLQNLQGGGVIPKQSPNRNVSSLRSYPSYADGGMMIAIQPMIIEKPVPVPMGRSRGISFPIAGVNNSTGNTPSLNKG